jgi:hypothetical protein
MKLPRVTDACTITRHSSFEALRCTAKVESPLQVRSATEELPGVAEASVSGVTAQSKSPVAGK